jgi:hypothetical protein
MSKKITERNRVILINVAVLVGLLWSYFRGDPPLIVLFSGIFLLAFANILMYVKRRRASK